LLLGKYEKYYINLFKLNNINKNIFLYNCTDGGDSGPDAIPFTIYNSEYGEFTGTSFEIAIKINRCYGNIESLKQGKLRHVNKWVLIKNKDIYNELINHGKIHLAYLRSQECGLRKGIPKNINYTYHFLYHKETNEISKNTMINFRKLGIRIDTIQKGFTSKGFTFATPEQIEQYKQLNQQNEKFIR